MLFGISFLVILIFLAIGALIGWIAGLVMKGKGFGCVGNIIIAVLGSVLGGFVTRLLGLNIGSFFTAVGGAILLLFIINLFSGKK